MKQKIIGAFIFLIAIPAVAGICVRAWHLCRALGGSDGFCQGVFDLCLKIMY